MTLTSTDTLAVLRNAVTGRVVTPYDPEWDDARAAWTLNVDQRPVAVVLAESALDVAEAVDFARRNGLRVTGQGTGHNAAALGDLRGTILVKTCAMRGITIDAAKPSARVEAGALWTELVHAAAAHGLGALSGSSPDVGVVGYTVGGGLSWLGRKHGLAANNVRSIELVTADGRVRHVDADSDPDLFWAVRGGGGNFGIVTAIELNLFPFTEVYAGAMFWPIERGDDVWLEWSDWVETLPEEMTTWARFMQFPPFEEIPEPLRGGRFMIVEACYLGDPAEADAVLAPMRRLRPAMDTIATIPTTMLSKVHMDPEEPVPAVGDGMMLDAFPPAAVEALVAAAGADSGSPLLSVEIRHLGGALGRIPDGAGALGRLRGQFAMFAVGVTPTPELEAVVRQATVAVRGALQPWDAGYGYLNFTERDAGPAYFFPPEVLDRLREIKAAYDPTNTIRGNHELG